MHFFHLRRGGETSREENSQLQWRCRGLNPGPFTCKANALPLRYIPSRVARLTKARHINPGKEHSLDGQMQKGALPAMTALSAAVTRIRTWVASATTKSTNHYTITAVGKCCLNSWGNVWSMVHTQPKGKGPNKVSPTAQRLPWVPPSSWFDHGETGPCLGSIVIGCSDFARP